MYRSLSMTGLLPFLWPLNPLFVVYYPPLGWFNLNFEEPNLSLAASYKVFHIISFHTNELLLKPLISAVLSLMELYRDSPLLEHIQSVCVVGTNQEESFRVLTLRLIPGLPSSWSLLFCLLQIIGPFRIESAEGEDNSPWNYWQRRFFLSFLPWCGRIRLPHSQKGASHPDRLSCLCGTSHWANHCLWGKERYLRKCIIIVILFVGDE